MYKIIFALSAIVAVASAGAVAVAPVLSGVSTVSRLDANIPLAVASPVAVVQAAPILSNPDATVIDGVSGLAVGKVASRPANVVFTDAVTGLAGLAGNVVVAGPIGPVVASPFASVIV